MGQKIFITKENLSRFASNVKGAIKNGDDALTTKVNTAQSTADAAKSAAATAQSTANSKLSSVKTINGKSIVGTGNLTLADIGIDGNIAQIVSALPELTAAVTNKIYLVPKDGATETNNTYMEYVKITVDGTAKWEKLGEWNPNIVVDSALSDSSTNPVQNAVVTKNIQETQKITNNRFEELKNKLAGKVDAVTGKALSTNDYTTAEKNKLAGIAEGANKTVVDSALSSTSANPVQNKVINTALAGKASTSVATQSADGLLSAADKKKLDGIAEGANKITVDSNIQ